MKHIPYPEKVKLSHKPRKITEETRRTIIHLFFTEELSARSIAKKLNISHTSCWNVCREHAIEKKDKSKRVSTKQIKKRTKPKPNRTLPTTPAEKWIEKERNRVYSRRWSLRKRILGYAGSNLSLSEMKEEYQKLTEYLPTINEELYEKVHTRRGGKKRID